MLARAEINSTIGAALTRLPPEAAVGIVTPLVEMVVKMASRKEQLTAAAKELTERGMNEVTAKLVAALFGGA